MSLTIRKIEARIVDHPVRQDGAILSSLGRHEASHYVTVTVTDDRGNVFMIEAVEDVADQGTVFNVFVRAVN